jgi:hypothetical protein
MTSAHEPECERVRPEYRTMYPVGPLRRKHRVLTAKLQQILMERNNVSILVPLRPIELALLECTSLVRCSPQKGGVRRRNARKLRQKF